MLTCMTQPFRAATALLLAIMAGTPSVMAGAQGPVDHVRLFGHYVQAELAMVRCRPADAGGQTSFIEHMKVVERRAVEQLKLRFPDQPPEKLEEMLGEGRRAMDKAIRETVAREGCSSPLIEDLLRRYRDFASRAP